MGDSCILVFTSRTIERMATEGVSQAWVHDPKRARPYPYLVCAWNPAGPFAESRRSHGEAFLVAQISSVEPAPEAPDRYVLRFSKFARISVPNLWTGKRNPVYYTSLEELGINPDTLPFDAVSSAAGSIAPQRNAEPSNLAPLAISAAKPRLAAYYGVPIEAIEIVIRG